MKKAIILHGKPTKEEYYVTDEDSQSNLHWLPWIQRELIRKDILAQTPELPRPYEPIYEDWLNIINQFKIDKDTILIGHSFSAGFLIRYLNEHDIKVGKVILVAPFINAGRVRDIDFFDFDIDPDLVSKTKGITLIASDNDKEHIKDSVTELSGSIKDIKYIELPNYGHFTFRHMQTREFPELLEETLK